MSDQNQEVSKLADSWAAAELDGDTASLKEILADDFVAVGPRGDPGTDHHPHDRDQHCAEGCCHPSRRSACETPKLRAPLAAAARKARIVLALPSMATLPGFHPRFCQPYLGSCGSGRMRSRLGS